MTTLGWSIVVGLAFGAGCWSLLGLVPRLSRPRLADRVAPYLLDVSASARQLVGRGPGRSLPVLDLLLVPLRTAAARLVGPLGGTADVVQLRLRQAGSTATVQEHRSQQLVWAALGGLGVGAAGVLVGRFGSLPLAAHAALVPLGTVLGLTLRDRVLVRAAARRLRRMSEELPTVLEFLTLSLSAGEGILDSVRRVSRIGSGELSREFRQVVADVHSGVPFSFALLSMGRSIQLPSLTRSLDQIAGALERGSPLGEVLRAQAQDATDEAKRILLESAGKKEVAMLVPLVFLILPTTILFAVFPGLFVLQTGF